MKEKKPEMVYDNDISTDYKKTSDKKYTHLHSSSFVVLGKLININRRYNKRIFLMFVKNEINNNFLNLKLILSVIFLEYNIYLMISRFISVQRDDNQEIM